MGFTLIELLVVVAIIALLMAILLPALARVRKQAKAMVCLSRLKQWGTTFALYMEENEGCLPAGSVNAVWMLGGAAAGRAVPNEPKLRQNVRTEGITCCPMATKPPDKPGGFTLSNGQVQARVGDVFGAWEITSPAPAFRGSYGMNADLFSSSDTRAANFWVGNKGAGLETNTFAIRIKGLARIPVLLDSVMPVGSPGAANLPPPTDPSRLAGPGMGVFCLNRHDAHVGGLFLDWSVRKVGLKELWTLKWHPNFKTAGRWTKAGGVKPEDWPKWMRNFKDY
jgi:prepilin-type N-terminal cleavage/methylation domain-containing protein